MKNNRHKGFSMIELILVIGIMGIFTALSSIGFGYLQSGNVKSAARNIDATLTKLRLDTMKQTNSPTMYIYKKGSDYYMYCTANTFLVPGEGSAAVGQKIGNRNVTISAQKGGSEKTLASGESFNIKFKKGSGAFSSTDITHIYVKHTDDQGRIQGIVYDIEMIPETGKHFINVN